MDRGVNMAKINWKEKQPHQAKRAKLKDKPFKNLSTKEKDELLEAIAIMLGLI